jgi:hypothetical protein
MGDTVSNNPFARLDTSLMRSTKTQEPGNPGTLKSGKTETQEAVKPVLQKPRNPGNELRIRRRHIIFILTL